MQNRSWLLKLKFFIDLQKNILCHHQLGILVQSKHERLFENGSKNRYKTVTVIAKECFKIAVCEHG